MKRWFSWTAFGMIQCWCRLIIGEIRLSRVYTLPGFPRQGWVCGLTLCASSLFRIFRVWSLYTKLRLPQVFFGANSPLLSPKSWLLPCAPSAKVCARHFKVRPAPPLSRCPPDEPVWWCWALCWSVSWPFSQECLWSMLGKPFLRSSRKFFVGKSR